MVENPTHPHCESLLILLKDIIVHPGRQIMHQLLRSSQLHQCQASPDGSEHPNNQILKGNSPLETGGGHCSLHYTRCQTPWLASFLLFHRSLDRYHSALSHLAFPALTFRNVTQHKWHISVFPCRSSQRIEQEGSCSRHQRTLSLWLHH